MAVQDRPKTDLPDEGTIEITYKLTGDGSGPITGTLVVDCADQTEQKNEALRMKLRGEVDAKTFREVTAEIDAAHDQLAREHNRLASEAAMPELPDPSLAWEDLSAEHRRALTELLVDKIIIAPHPTKSRITASATAPSAPSHTKIPRWKPRA